MASYYWIKLYHEILNDPKMGRLSNRIWRRAIELFLLAGDSANDGTLPPTSDMAWRLRIPEDELIKDLEALAEVNIVALNDNQWHVVNFIKRQGAIGNAERQRQYRDRQRKVTLNQNEDETQDQQKSNESITKRNADYNITLTDIDTDIDIDKEADIAPSAATAPPSPPKSKRKSPKPKTKTPEAVRVFRENAHRYPPKAWYPKIAETVGEKPADLELWGQVVLAYIGLGWNPGNVSNMLDFYERREIPTTKGQQGKNARSGPDEWLARRQEAGMGGAS